MQCAEVTLNNTVPLTQESMAAVIAGSFNRSTTQLHSLLWWATPSNVVPTCSLYPNASSTNTAASNTFQLDLLNTAAATATATGAPVPQAPPLPASGCTAWPCSLAAPFGGAYAVVDEVASAPKIGFQPSGCTGSGCFAPFYGTPFLSCPNGQVTAPTSTPYWASSPCSAAAKSAGNNVWTSVGNNTNAPPPPPSTAALLAAQQATLTALIPSLVAAAVASLNLTVVSSTAALAQSALVGSSACLLACLAAVGALGLTTTL